MSSSRRDFLRGAAGAGAGLLGALVLRRPIAAQSSESATPMVTPLRGDLLQVSGLGGNVVVLPAADGLLLVDSGAATAAGALESLLAERFSGAPVRVLFNTHWHLDHTGGNDRLARSSPTIVAHENTRLWMSTKFYVDWEQRRYSPRAAAARPNKTFFASDPQPLSLAFGRDQPIYAQLRGAHTDGDIFVAFPEHNVIAAGGAAVAGHYPTLDYSTGGWIGGLVDATKALLDRCEGDTLIVPESGPALRRADLVRQQTMLEAVRERVEHLALQGKGIDDIVAAGITKEFDATYGTDSAQFIANTYQGLWWGNRLRGAVA